jgi:hypothetical protein
MDFLKAFQLNENASKSWTSQKHDEHETEIRISDDFLMLFYKK